MDNETAKFLPFNAINEFMRDDYRLTVVRTALEAKPEMSEEWQQAMDQVTRKVVKVPGFRNSLKAPIFLKTRAMAEAFQKSPELVAVVLSIWSEAHSDLRQKVYDLLRSRRWEVLPPETNRAVLPGFLIRWPKGDDFDVLIAAFHESYPDTPADNDDISLMVVWMSMRLPYQLVDEDDEQGETGEEGLGTEGLLGSEAA
jgi:hypothetical protein